MRPHLFFFFTKSLCTTVFLFSFGPLAFLYTTHSWDRFPGNYQVSETILLLHTRYIFWGNDQQSTFFYKHSVFNLRLEHALVFHKFSLKICLRYVYLRTLKRANFMIWPTPDGSELVEGIKMKKILKFVPSRLLISLT